MSDTRYLWRRRIGGWLTPAFRFYWRRTRAMTLGVRVLATDSEGRICLVRHSYIDGWHLPGGGVERDEDVCLSAEREVAEEAGLSPEPGALILAGVFRNPAFRGDHIVLFHLHRWVACAAKEDGEITDRIWADPDRLPRRPARRPAGVSTNTGAPANRLATGSAGWNFSALSRRYLETMGRLKLARRDIGLGRKAQPERIWTMTVKKEKEDVRQSENRQFQKRILYISTTAAAVLLFGALFVFFFLN